MTGPVCQQIKAEVSSLCDAPPGRYLIMYEIDIRAFGGSLSTSQPPPPPPPLGLLVSRPIVPSFASSSRTHAPLPPSLFSYLLDRCISSLRLKSCQVRRVFRLFISKNDSKVYFCFSIFLFTKEFDKFRNYLGHCLKKVRFIVPSNNGNGAYSFR